MMLDRRYLRFQVKISIKNKSTFLCVSYFTDTYTEALEWTLADIPISSILWSRCCGRRPIISQSMSLYTQSLELGTFFTPHGEGPNMSFYSTIRCQELRPLTLIAKGLWYGILASVTERKTGTH